MKGKYYRIYLGPDSIECLGIETSQKHIKAASTIGFEIHKVDNVATIRYDSYINNNHDVAIAINKWTNKQKIKDYINKL